MLRQSQAEEATETRSTPECEVCPEPRDWLAAGVVIAGALVLAFLSSVVRGGGPWW